MAMLKMDRVREVASGPPPDRGSNEFRNAVGTVSALLKRCKDAQRRADLESIQSALLAHGGPTEPVKLSKAELSAIRREASARGLVARAKRTLLRKITESKTGVASISDRRPAVFDAALELVEDGVLRCTFETWEGVYPGPEPEEGRQKYRRISVVDQHAKLPEWVKPRAPMWKSRRKQDEERI